MSFGTWANVFGHFYAIPLIYEICRRREFILLFVALMSVVAASPAYHLCYDNIWCVFRLRVLTRVDLFHSQGLVTGTLLALVPFPHIWQYLAIFLSVWIVQAIILLRYSANTRVLQYIVVLISVAPLIIYVGYKYFMYFYHKRPPVFAYEEGEDVCAQDPVAWSHVGGVTQRKTRSTASSPSSTTFIFRNQKWMTRKQTILPFFYSLYNPRDFLLGVLIGLLGLAQFRLHDILHTKYNLLHPTWHAFIFLGAYFLLRSAPPRGVAFSCDPDQVRKWKEHVTDTELF